MSWQQLEKQLNARARDWAALGQAEDEKQAYEAWAARAVPACLDDLEHNLRQRMTTFEHSLRNSLTVTRAAPVRPGMPYVLCLALGLDEVHIHGQWEPGRAPTVHLLKCRKRADRFARLLPIAGGWLLPHESGPRYRIQSFASATSGPAAIDDVTANDTGRDGAMGSGSLSGHEITPDQLLYRALALFTLR